jgi:hypothetical protein
MNWLDKLTKALKEIRDKEEAGDPDPYADMDLEAIIAKGAGTEAEEVALKTCPCCKAAKPESDFEWHDTAWRLQCFDEDVYMTCGGCVRMGVWAVSTTGMAQPCGQIGDIVPITGDGWMLAVDVLVRGGMRRGRA